MKRYRLLLLLLAMASACTTGRRPADHVDPFVGTGFHGHTYPGATAPRGAVQLSPDTRTGDWDACSGYHYSDSTIIGFSHTHLSGTGCIDLGDVLIRPFDAPAAFSHRDEKASPGYYSVMFRDEGVRAELTATTYAGIHRYTFDRGRERRLTVDMTHLLGEETIDSIALRRCSANEIAGMRRTQGWTPDQYIFFVAQFSEDFASANISEHAAELCFGPSDGRPLVVKVGLSIVGEDNARENLTCDTGESFDFDALHRRTRREWDEALSSITVEGGGRDETVNFYTAMYHAMVVPNIVSDRNGQYRRNNGQVAQLPDGERRYSTFSLWDAFRAWNPLMTLVDRELVESMIGSLLDMYDATGELPVWPLSSGETGTMIGYHSASVIADAYMKGIRGFDAEKALEAMINSSNADRKGIREYVAEGFIPAERKRESVSCLLEYAYDDWCIARMAEAMGRKDVAGEYYRRSLSYVNVFDGHTRFFRGKRSGGNWERPFDPCYPGRAYTEATAWQYRFCAPHDIYGLAQLFGGQESFAAVLDSLFTAEAKIGGEMADITGLVGQYAHGNEPSHHIAFLYNYLGQPWKTQAMARRILKEMYSPAPEGLSGNEDCGQMSAWYVLCSLGIYPVCPGSNEFILASPLFPRATVRLAGGKTLRITANSPSKNRFIRKVELNGKAVGTGYITYEQLAGGGELAFTLCPEPDRSWEVAEEARPFSLTARPTVSIPYTTKDLEMFVGKLTVDLACATPDARIYYTLDGTQPDEMATPYVAPFELSASRTVHARAYREGYCPSPILTVKATKAVFSLPVNGEGRQNGCRYSYYEGFFLSVADMNGKTPVKEGALPAPSIEGALRPDHFGFIFTGLLSVPEDGVYEFMTVSDDGSVLYIADRKVADNDGSHAAVEASGRIALKKGCHRFRLLYFEDYEGESLRWFWKKPSDGRFEPVPESAIFVK
ncbi:MAG: GH92 family glycosyl hydrolase [Rikenellaceae bacterium]|jgi:predicted alpha-1,2-mannosidase|nr:GH92 family glycosyl hydrolase [Rikenellaceae bacterium]